MKTETAKFGLADEWVAPVKPIHVDFPPRNHLVTSRFSLRQTWSSLVQVKNNAPDFGVETANCTPLFFILHSSFCIGCTHPEVSRNNSCSFVSIRGSPSPQHKKITKRTHFQKIDLPANKADSAPCVSNLDQKRTHFANGCTNST